MAEILAGILKRLIRSLNGVIFYLQLLHFVALIYMHNAHTIMYNLLNIFGFINTIYI